MSEPINERQEKPAYRPPTGSVFRFSSFQEMFDRVPASAIRECMEELGTILGAAKSSCELAYHVAADLAAKDGKKFPPMPARLAELPAEFEWADDGKRDLQCDLQGLFTVKITKKQNTPGQVCGPAERPKS